MVMSYECVQLIQNLFNPLQIIFRLSAWRAVGSRVRIA